MSCRGSLHFKSQHTPACSLSKPLMSNSGTEGWKHQRFKYGKLKQCSVCVCVCMPVGGQVGVSFYLCALRPNNLQNSWLRHKTAQRVCVCVCVCEPQLELCKNKITKWISKAKKKEGKRKRRKGNTPNGKQKAKLTDSSDCDGDCSRREFQKKKWKQK